MEILVSDKKGEEPRQTKSKYGLFFKCHKIVMFEMAFSDKYIRIGQ